MNQIEFKKRQMEMGAYVLGLIVVLLIGNMLKNNGVTYLAVGLFSFLAVWLLTGGCLADTLGRLLRIRSGKGQYKNARKLRRTALMIEILLGIIGSVLLFAAAKLVGEELFGLTYVVPMIRILAPVVLISTMSSVLLGYFQGEGTELPTVISYIARPVCLFGFALLFANLFQNYGLKVSALLKEENFTAMYAGMGVALAILVTELLLFVFLFFVYRGSRRKYRRTGGEGMRTTDTIGGQIAVLFGNLGPSVLKAVLIVLPLWLGVLFYNKNVTNMQSFQEYGVFIGKFMPVFGFGILPGWMMLMDSSHKIAGCVRREESRFAKNYFQCGFHMAVVYGLFATIFMAILSPQIAGVICEDQTALLTGMIRFGAYLVLVLVMGFFMSEFLTAMGGKLYVLGLLAVFNLIYTISLILFINGGKAGIMALIYAAMVAATIYVIGASVLSFMQLRVMVDWLQGIAIPLVSACVTGLILLFAGKAMAPHLGNLITIVVSFVIGNVIYWAILLFLRNFREQDLAYTPCGRIIRAVGQLFRAF